MGEYRDRFEQELRLRGYSERTVDSYVHQVKRFVKHFMRSPVELGATEIREYLVHVTEVEKLAPATINQSIFALRFFYREILDRPWEEKFTCRRRGPVRLPTVLTSNEVSRLLAAATNQKHRVLMMVLYSAGLRLNEALSLESRDIEVEEERIRVRCAKGGRERYVMLSRRLLEELRVYVREQPRGRFLFPGKTPGSALGSSGAQRMVRSAGRRAGITKKVTPHVLRHSFATHLVEQGTNLLYVQTLLGHRDLKTTLNYTRVARQGATRVMSPLDALGNTTKA